MLHEFLHILAVKKIKQLFNESMRQIVSTYQDMASIQGKGGRQL